MEKITNDLTDPINRIRKDLIEPIKKSRENILKQIKTQYSIKKTFVDFSGIIDEFIETGKDINTFKFIMAETGYPPHQRMDIPKIRSIATAYKNKNLDLINSIDMIMCDYYDADFILYLLELWEEISNLQNRLPILRNVIRAHNLGMYYVSIPALLAQFEGTVVEALKITGRVDGEIFKVLLNILLKNDHETDLDIERETYKYYKENLLVSFDHGLNPESEISRHAILHGGITDYGKQSNSLKLILLFDFIIEKVISVDEAMKIEAQAKIKKIRRDRKRKNKTIQLK